ncbi:unnamed protein product [Caenorhabditis angaria]|uniref:Serpentine receptor class gamma n=1 Tax=Caenorhabditis angaria TaxID=860376 RepID=A0A9P1ITN7_9PELO|nr:unnamed protein product [Caenorhabditis angaria]
MFTLKFAITVFYGGLSFVAYFLTVFMMRANWKEFSIAFFRLYIAFFIYNLITFVNSFITVRIPQNTCKDCYMSFLFKAHSQNNTSWFPLNFFYTIHYSMAFVQYAMIMFVSINRCSMIFNLTSYNNQWKRIFPCIIVLVSLFPLTQTYPIFFNTAYYVYTEALDCYSTKTLANTATIYSHLLIYMGVTTIITALANIFAFCKLSLMNSKIPKGEQNLMFVSLAMFFVQLFAGGNTIINRLFVSDSNATSTWSQIAQTLIPFTSDGLTLIHPWILLAFSKRVRKCMMKTYFPRYVTTPITIAVQSGKSKSDR